MRWIHLIARRMSALRPIINRAFAKPGFVVMSVAIAACGRDNLASPPGATALSASAEAQPATLHVDPLHEFTAAETFIGKSGGSAGLIGDPNTALFGVAPIGGDLKCRDGHQGCGFVYELTPQDGGKSYKETRLYAFHGKNAGDGAEPSAALVMDESSAGVLYGTTVLGGAYDKGTVFKLAPTQSGSYTETVLYSFGPTAGDGEYPYASLIEIQGTLYGTASGGGMYHGGVAFSVSAAGTSEQKLYDFGNGSDGATPYASLINVNGTLYGTTSAGGGGGTSTGCGTVFSMSTAGVEQVLYAFQGSRPYGDGCNPLGSGVIDVNGLLYGTTSAGGGKNNKGITCDCGTIYSVGMTPGPDTVLHSFVSNGSPAASLIYSNGALYGTAFYGGKCTLGPRGCGVVFSLGPSGSPSYQVQFVFTGTSGGGGANPAAPLLANGGNFYGTSSSGGTHNHGEAFELTP
jgi:uncharacterized repeat protein (TIGR03803 family)